MTKDHKLVIKEIINWLFVISFFLLLLFYFLRRLLGPVVIIEDEYRYATTVPKLTSNNFLTQDYQNGLEESIADQLIGAKQLKRLALSTHNYYLGFLSKFIYPNQNYKIVAKDYWSYQNEDYLVGLPNDQYFMNEYNYNQFQDAANIFNTIKLPNKYLYLVTNDDIIDFNNVTENICNGIKKMYVNYKTDCLKIDSFDTYKKYYYKTDNHWNYVGQYQGYKDIINLLFDGREPVLRPKETIHTNLLLSGTKARISGYYRFKEQFSYYTFDIPEYKTYINGVEKEYNHINYYKDLNNFKYMQMITYHDYYGYDEAEVIYDFNNPNKENLLILGYSDTNAINHLIASHFNKTYIIDLRHYNNFKVNEYIEKNNITKLLLIGKAYVFNDIELTPEVD